MTRLLRLQSSAAVVGLYLSIIGGAAAEVFPKPEWRDQPDPIASLDAEVGGELTVFVGQSPKSFNYYLDNNTFSAQLFGFMFDTLLSVNSLTYDYEPGIADQWSISDDKLVFTFRIDERARWSDGKPITADDVKWTYDAIMDPKNLTGPFKVSMEKFHPPEIVNSRQIRFKSKEVHWRNLLALGGLEILPKHIFEKTDFNKINFEFPVVSGMYRLGMNKESVFLTIQRRDDWWQRRYKRTQGIGNFETIKFKFFAERENAFEEFRKGMIDLYPVYTARRWVKEATGERYSRNWIVKQKIFNSEPVGFQGFAMNMRKPPFNDARVRKSMAHLLDREKLNRTLMDNQYFLHRSFVEDLYSEAHPCPNEPIQFEKAKARKLLKDAGWTANPKTGLLEKNGNPFRFKFLYRDSYTEKFLSIYAEDLKDVGIDIVLDRKDWAAWAKDMDEFNYDMTWAAWSQSVYKDPEGMWSSKEADRPSGSNITGFKNDRVDELIEKQKTIFDIRERNAINREIDRIVYAEFPYALLWNLNYTRLLYWNKFGTPDTVLSKFGDERSGYVYWWYDEGLAYDLEAAMDSGLSLPKKPEVVKFDDFMK